MNALSPINELNGIIPSLHTPFLKNKSIDYKSFEKLVLYTIDTNCAGMLLSAVAGETQNLTFNEKSEIMEFVLDVNRNTIPIIFGCSSSKLEEIFLLVDLARQKKIKWVLIQAPLSLNESELIAFYKKINEIGPSHLMIQDLSWDGYGLTDKTIKNLRDEVPKFKSLKIEVMNSGKKYSNIINLTKNKLHLTGGWAATGFIEAIRRGVHGFIPSTMETIYNSVYNLMLNNEEKEARKLFYRILPAISFAHQHIDISIKFYKMLRVTEEIFSTDVCRGDIQEFDEFQRYEAQFHINTILNIQKELLNKNN
tara:strand:+ start:587 stop:1513 length:927 start_codon:yes stop_codon:yes gene_type:complete